MSRPLEEALRHCLRTLERADTNFGSDREMDRAAWGLQMVAPAACRVARRALGDQHSVHIAPGRVCVAHAAGFDLTCSCGWSGGRYTTRQGAINAGDKHMRFE